MAIVRKWDGRGLVDGTLLATTAGLDDDDFDQVNGVWTVTADGGHSSTISSDPAVGGGGRTVVWGGLTGTAAACATRHYVDLSGLPSGETDLVILKGAGGAQSLKAQLRPTGVFLVRDSTNTSTASTATLPGAGLYRVEVQQQSATAAVLSIYSGESATPLESVVVAGTFIDVINVQFGQDGSDSENMPTYGQRNMAVADTADAIGAYVEPAAPPSPTVAIIGDSLTWQDGAGEAAIRAVFEADGFGTASTYWYAVGGKPFTGADADGKTVAQNVAEARAQLGTVDHWLIALGTNDVSETDTAYVAGVQAVMDEIGAEGDVAWVGLAFFGAENSNAAHFNPIIESTVTAAGGRYANWQDFIHDGRDETGLWVFPTDSTHMTPAGYAIRNDFYVLAVNDQIPAPGTPGLFGDSLTYSLNRLAGTLSNGVPLLAPVGAANLYAGTSGLGLQGALNVKNGSVGVATQGVLNELAGTSGLAVDEAARRIEA